MYTGFCFSFPFRVTNLKMLCTFQLLLYFPSFHATQVSSPIKWQCDYEIQISARRLSSSKTIAAGTLTLMSNLPSNVVWSLLKTPPPKYRAVSLCVTINGDRKNNSFIIFLQPFFRWGRFMEKAKTNVRQQKRFSMKTSKHPFKLRYLL